MSALSFSLVSSSGVVLSNFIDILFSCSPDASTALISYFWVPSLNGTWTLKVPSAARGTSSPPIVSFAEGSVAP